MTDEVNMEELTGSSEKILENGSLRNKECTVTGESLMSTYQKLTMSDVRAFLFMQPKCGINSLTVLKKSQIQICSKPESRSIFGIKYCHSNIVRIRDKR